MRFTKEQIKEEIFLHIGCFTLLYLAILSSCFILLGIISFL